MSLEQTLISKVQQLTTLVNQLISAALTTADLPSATTPLGDTDLIRVVQAGVSKKVEYQNFGGGSGFTGVIAYQDQIIWKASGNVSSTLEVGDIIARWWSPTEYWNQAVYNGGDTAVKTNYTILSSFEGL